MPGIKFYRDPNLSFFEIKACDSGIHSRKKHAHQEFSLGVVEKGESLVDCEGKVFTVGKRSIILIPPGIVHSCSPRNANDWQFRMLYLKSEWIQSLFNAKLVGLGIAFKILNAEDFIRSTALFDVLQQNVSAIEKESFLIQELDYFFDLENYFSQSGLFTENTVAATQIKDYLQANFLERICLDDLAAISGLSKYQVIRAFEKNYSLAPHSYQTMLRINYAKEELRKGRAIADVASDAGFFDQSHFSKTFKQYAGTTPLDYLQS